MSIDSFRIGLELSKRRCQLESYLEGDRLVST